MMSTGTSGRIYKIWMPKIIFSKYKYEILNHVYFAPNFDFWGDCFGAF